MSGSITEGTSSTTSTISPTGTASSGGKGSDNFIIFTKTGQVYHSGEASIQFELQRTNENVQVASLTCENVSNPDNMTRLDYADASKTEGSLFQKLVESEPRVFLNATHLRINPDLLGKPLVVGVNWTVSGGGEVVGGITYSPAFAIIDANAGPPYPTAEEAISKSSYHISVEHLRKAGDRGGMPTPLPTSASGNDNTNGTSNLLPPGRGGGSGRGLKTGAIVGIAVGIGIAALLAAALGVFFFLRRRRRLAAADGGPSSAARDQTRAAEQEKLSAFPKDGGGSSSLVAGGNASDAAIIAPYRDDNASPTTNTDRRRSSAAREDAAGAGDRESRTATMTTQQLQNGVSRHLVEDGMTADEIRRLEEEEAHLDNEIQRAGGRRG